MWRAGRWLLFLAALWLLILPGEEWAFDLKKGDFNLDLQEEAVTEIARQAVAAVPRDIHLRLLGIGPIEGDTGRLAEALSQAFGQEGHFVLVERPNLETLLAEHGLQVSDLVDETERIEPGRIKGVEAILFGRVVGRRPGFLSYNTKVNLTLDDVQSGEVKFMQNFQATAVSPLRNPALRVMGLVLLLAWWSAARRASRSRRTAEAAASGRMVRQKLAGQVKAGQGLLRRAEALLAKDRETPLADRVGRSQGELSLLWAEVAGLADGPVSARDRRSLRLIKRLRSFDEGSFRHLKRVSDLAQQIHDEAARGARKKMGDRLECLSAAVHEAKSRLAHRPL